MSDTKESRAAYPDNTNVTDVYAIHGADPEVLAYAMAKYSRSALSMKESLAEISSQRAEQFLNTFYFQYGHRSIADLAHLAFAIERLSLLAAIALVDEQRWDGQERSTRYQDFKKSGWYTPAVSDVASYTSAITSLLSAYERIGAGMLEALKAAIAKPEEMKDDAYVRTLKARAFDVARYLLPLATNTSLGQIVNARTLEQQIARLLGSETAEIRMLGEKLRSAASEPAWNVYADEARVLCQEIASVDGPCGERASTILQRDVRVAPTLVKYTAPSEYERTTKSELQQAANDLMCGAPIDPAPIVDLVDDSCGLETELATSLLYPHCHYSYRQLRNKISGLPTSERDAIAAIGARHRGRHDELIRAFSSGHGFGFDILMDIGGFRDMHRHRRCIQLIQDYTDLHSYDIPECPGQPTLADAGVEADYKSAMDAAFTAYRTLRDSGIPEAAHSAAYLLPLGTRVRALFKMDFAEALYISEIRSGVAGHFSYRRVAWEMYQAVAKRHPSLAHYFRVAPIDEPIDLLKR